MNVWRRQMSRKKGCRRQKRLVVDRGRKFNRRQAQSAVRRQVQQAARDVDRSRIIRCVRRPATCGASRAPCSKRHRGSNSERERASALSDNDPHVLCIIACDKRLTCDQPCNRLRSCRVRPGARGPVRSAGPHEVMTLGVGSIVCGPRTTPAIALVKGVEVSNWPQRIDTILGHRIPGWLLAVLVVVAVAAVRLLLSI